MGGHRPDHDVALTASVLYRRGGTPGWALLGSHLLVAASEWREAHERLGRAVKDTQL